MSTPVIAFFNNRGGVGKTSLVYHLAWMYADKGLRVVAADLDPQANLSAAFLDEDRLEELWPDGNHPETICGCIQPLLFGTGEIAIPHLENVQEQRPRNPTDLLEGNLSLIVGDLALFGFEDDLSGRWSECLDRKERAFRVISAFWRIMQNAAALNEPKADIILVDLGPNLGAINRAALIAADYVVVPLSPDLFSLQGLRNLGPTLKRWREEWRERYSKKPVADNLEIPEGRIQPIGYIVLQHSVRLDRPVKAYDRWIAQIPQVYRGSVLGESEPSGISIADDPHCLALLKHYRSLMPMAQQAHKPIFHLKPADGAIGAHSQAAQDAYHDFEQLARLILNRAVVPAVI